MPSGYSRSPKLAKGAFIRLDESFLMPIPKVIVFQYNPETLSRTLESSGTKSDTGGTAPKKNAQVEPYNPTEKISLTLDLDATDALEEPETHLAERVSGIAGAIGDLESLLYPAKEDALKGLTFSLLDKSTYVKPTKVPVVLFSWGVNRLVPVRFESFSVKEEAFSPLLVPIRAKVEVTLRVITDEEIEQWSKSTSDSEKLAAAAYKYTKECREAVSTAAGALDTAASVLGGPLVKL